jgi:chemotaxis protein MotB
MRMIMCSRKRVFGMFLSLGLLARACGVPQDQYDADIAELKAEIDKMSEELGASQQALQNLDSEKKRLEAKLFSFQAELTQLASERDKNALAAEAAKKRLATFRKMLESFRSMVESGKLKIKVVNNKMIVEMASAILFPSGRARLSSEGKEAIAQVAGILSGISDRNFQVIGHTDDVPIRRNKRFKSNWELSSARSVAVVKHLINNGMPATHVSAAGYADTQPAASNDTADGKAQNRRIEIVLQPNLDELPDLSALEKML